MRAAAPAQRRAMSLLTLASLAQSSVSSRTCCSRARRWRLSPIAVRSRTCPLRSSGWGSPATWATVSRASRSRGGCGRGRRAGSRAPCGPTASSTASGSSDSPMPLLRAARARASWLYSRSALRWRAPSTARQTWRPTVSRKRSSSSSKRWPGRRGHVEDAAARAVEGERDAGVGHRLLEPVADHRHARALGGVPGLARPGPRRRPAGRGTRRGRAHGHDREVRGRDPAVGGEAQAAGPSRPRGRSRRSRARGRRGGCRGWCRGWPGRHPRSWRRAARCPRGRPAPGGATPPPARAPGRAPSDPLPSRDDPTLPGPAPRHRRAANPAPSASIMTQVLVEARVGCATGSLARPVLRAHNLRGYENARKTSAHPSVFRALARRCR